MASADDPYGDYGNKAAMWNVPRWRLIVEALKKDSSDLTDSLREAKAPGRFTASAMGVEDLVSQLTCFAEAAHLEASAAESQSLRANFEREKAVILDWVLSVPDSDAALSQSIPRDLTQSAMAHSIAVMRTLRRELDMKISEVESLKASQKKSKDNVKLLAEAVADLWEIMREDENEAKE